MILSSLTLLTLSHLGQLPPFDHKDAFLELRHKESPCLSYGVGVWQEKTEALWFLGLIEGNRVKSTLGQAYDSWT